MVNLSALTTEALSRSDVLWVRSGERHRPTWFATGAAGTSLADHVLLVSGGPEPDLGPLDEEVELVLRSKGDGGRLLTLRTRARSLEPGSAAWDEATSPLLAERLNAPAGLVDDWRERSTVWALLPFGAPVQAPGRPGPDAPATSPVEPGGAASPTRRPWHLGSRADARRARRRQG